MIRARRSRVIALAGAIVIAATGLGAPATVQADTTLTFAASADAQVYSSNTSTNYGTLATLRTREGTGTSSDPIYRTYLAFDVSGLSGPVTGVTLRLSVTDASANNQGVYAVAGGWTETTIAFGSAPTIGGTPLGTGLLNAVGSLDIVLAPSSVPGNGMVWLGMRSAATDSAIFSSREGSVPPLLIVTAGTVSAPPVAAFGATPTSGTAPRKVDFTDASTNGPTAWSWDFGDPASGTDDTSSLQNPSHVYADPGTYDVTLTASNSLGTSDPLTKTAYVTLTDPPPPIKPVAAFSGSPRSGTAPRKVDFTDASTNGPTAWSWDFGDPASGANDTSSLQNPSHTYADPGTYDVTLTASNNAGPGDPLTRTSYISVTAPSSGTAVLVGAGDIADCGRTQDSKTATLLAGIPGTVFAAGDLTYPNGTTAEFADCYGPTWGAEKARTRPIVGNHEYNTSGAAPYYAYWGSAAGDPSKGYYSYDIGGWHAIVLNANCSKAGGCGAGSAQERWLLAELQSSSAQCAVAFWHQARFSSTRSSPDNGTLALWQDLYNYGAEIAIAGHYHNYERFAPQSATGLADPATGVRQFVVGTGGASLGGFKSTTMANSEVREKSTYGVLKLTLHASSYDWQFVPIAGQSFTDSGSASCHGRPSASTPLARLPGGALADLLAGPDDGQIVVPDPDDPK
jgi:PKD repeat protein